jgi:hypothetical protein
MGFDMLTFIGDFNALVGGITVYFGEVKWEKEMNLALVYRIGRRLKRLNS